MGLPSNKTILRHIKDFSQHWNVTEGTKIYYVKAVEIMAETQQLSQILCRNDMDALKSWVETAKKSHASKGVSCLLKVVETCNTADLKKIGISSSNIKLIYNGIKTIHDSFFEKEKHQDNDHTKPTDDQLAKEVTLEELAELAEKGKREITFHLKHSRFPGHLPGNRSEAGIGEERKLRRDLQFHVLTFCVWIFVRKSDLSVTGETSTSHLRTMGRGNEFCYLVPKEYALPHDTCIYDKEKGITFITNKRKNMADLDMPVACRNLMDLWIEHLRVNSTCRYIFRGANDIPYAEGRNGAANFGTAYRKHLQNQLGRAVGPRMMRTILASSDPLFANLNTAELQNAATKMDHNILTHLAHYLKSLPKEKERQAQVAAASTA